MTEKKRSAVERLLKAAREIFIIVISILVAFALDAWWDLRQEGKSEQRVLSDLVVEFDDFFARLDRYVDRNNEVISAADSILQRLSTGRAPVAVSSALVSRLLLTPTLDPHQRNLEALVASGTLDLVQSDSLRVLLAFWPSVLDDSREEETAARTFVHEILIPDLGASVDLDEAYRWRIEEVYRWEGFGDDEEATGGTGGEATVFIPPERQVENLIQARRYHSALVNMTYRYLAVYAGDIARLLRTSVR